MRHLLRRIACWLGFHEWLYFVEPNWRWHQRVCLRCAKNQHQTYDMCYGETYWGEGKP